MLLPISLFRPVNVANGPDGSLYVMDMYTGIIQDAQFVGANASSMVFPAVSVQQEDFSRANLTGANLSGATLRRTDLWGATLTGDRPHVNLSLPGG